MSEGKRGRERQRERERERGRSGVEVLAQNKNPNLDFWGIRYWTMV